MNKFLKIILLAICCLFVSGVSSFADNITIDDNRHSTQYTWWNNGSGSTGNEVNEVEPGMVMNSSWDLQAFYLDGFILSMVGTYNFATGTGYYSTTNYGNEINTNAPVDAPPGDIFISTGEAPTYGVDGGTSPFGYEYVIDIDWLAENYSYRVYETSQGTLSQVESYNQTESDPFAFTVDYDEYEDYLKQGTFTITGTETYTVDGFDLSWLEPGTEFYSHFTIACGNDNLMGMATTPVPEPATMLLLGTGLIGLAGFGRKKFKNDLKI